MSPVNYLKLEKVSTANGAYDDGLYLNFGKSTPGHISVRMSTNASDVESCDLRLTTMEYNFTY